MKRSLLSLAVLGTLASSMAPVGLVRHASEVMPRRRKDPSNPADQARMAAAAAKRQARAQRVKGRR